MHEGRNAGRGIVISGGSFAGLALARALALALDGEVPVALVERQPLRAPGSGPADPRAYALSAASKEMLDALGVWSVLAADAQPVRAIDITDSALEHAVRPVLVSYDNTVGGGRPATWIVEGYRLKAALLAAVTATPGVSVFAPSEVCSISHRDTHMAVTLGNGATVQARLLIGADGRHSPVREAAGIKTVKWNRSQVGIVTSVTHERPHDGRAVQHFLPAGPFAILPLRGNRSCITWTEESARGRAITALDDGGFLREVEQRFGYRLGALALDGPRAAWPLDFQLARAMTAQRCALVGDAVRSVHPIAGQGMNLGFRDVAALTQCVVEAMRLGLDPGDGTVLERYERWRRFDSVMSAAVFDGLNGLFSNDDVLARATRDAGLGILNRLPALKHALVSEAAGWTGEVPKLLKGERV